MATGRSYGMFALALWLVLYGAFHFVAAPAEGSILAILALIAGLMIFLGR